MGTSTAEPAVTIDAEPGLMAVPARFKPTEHAALKEYAESEGRSMSMQLKVWALERMKQLGLLGDGTKS